MIEPRTVTFDAPPQSEAQYRSARLASSSINWTLGVAVNAATAVAFIAAISLAVSLASDWRDVAIYSLIAIVVTGALTGIPVVTAMLGQSYAKDSVSADRAWRVSMLVVALAVGFSIFKQSWLQPVAAVSTPAPAHTYSMDELGTAEYAIPDYIWYQTNGCQSVWTAEDRRWCSGVVKIRKSIASAQHDSTSTSTDWTPAGVLPVSMVPDGAIRQIAVLALVMLCVIIAGQGRRWLVLSVAESYRLAEGTAGFAQHSVSTAIPMIAPVDSVSDDDVFNMWANSRLYSKSGCEVSVDRALQDYKQTCQDNGREPLTDAKFAKLLIQKAQLSDGGVTKVKSNGRMVYRGWMIPDQLETVMSASGLALPQK